MTGIGICKYIDLQNNFEYSTGRIVKFTSGGTAGGLHFSYEENPSKYNSVMGVGGQACRKLITQKMNILRRYEFPVVYSRKNLDNASILIFEHQYEQYKLDIPKNLKAIVAEISICKE